MRSSGIIYSHDWHNPTSRRLSQQPLQGVALQKTLQQSAPYRSRWTQMVGIGLVALAMGGVTGPFTPRILLETKYAYLQAIRTIPGMKAAPVPGIESSSAQSTMNPVIPAVFNPLATPGGATIEPVDKNFGLIIPKIGINASVIPTVNPNKPGEYQEALKRGIAHSSLSYFPDQNGTVYLFSHSTNYEWFVSDLNAVFYLLKNLETDDVVVLSYKESLYTYKITDKKVVKPTDISYIAPQAGARRLILQTCWPPGLTSERLLIFADLVEEQRMQI